MCQPSSGGNYARDSSAAHKKRLIQNMVDQDGSHLTEREKLLILVGDPSKENFCEEVRAGCEG